MTLAVPPTCSPSNDAYTVGWICALSIEYLAAQLCLDEEHERSEYIPENDNNDYTLGRVGKHNVVIAVLPNSGYGTSSAASVARDMLHSFPNVRIGLMVGIGGGAPRPNHDIRLGDIVVSVPRDREGGVLQYDFGKTIQGQSFRLTGFLNQPPTLLQTAVNGLKTQYQRKRHQLKEVIDFILEKKDDLRDELSRPDASSDRLYRSDLVHPRDVKNSCVEVCGVNPTDLVKRPERTNQQQNPVVHHGLIASANQLMKDALVRDRLAAERDILCFEMEAAGLMNHFPCLVIRGICDYSDSHKNKEWQGYAAIAAAAYAKDLLCRIAPNRVKAEKKISDILSGLYGVAEEHLDVAKEHRNIAEEQLQAQRHLDKKTLFKEEQKCHQLFRLTTSSTYEWYKNRVEERVEGTCMWFLNHEHFQTWLKQDSGTLLVTADPGCGKSVLAKYLIDHGLPHSETICYFFFKEQDQNTVQQALCALLHQLFSLKPSLIKHAMPQFRKDGLGLINSVESLWEVLRNAIKDPQAGPIIVVLDALDECAESEFLDLVRNVKNQFRSDQSGYSKLKYLLTCRPYEQLISKFYSPLGAFPNIRIPGEEESETISREVNCVIMHEANQLSTEKRLSPEIKSDLEKGLQETTHRTYLWVYLVFDYLRKEVFKRTLKGVKSAIATLPRSISQAYEQILQKSKEDPMVPKALSVILAASRPLTLSEMNVAMNIDYTSQSIHDLDLEIEQHFKERLRSCCGLFISVHQGRIYFIHQTARDFLLADSAAPITVSRGLRWQHSITSRDAHAVLAKLCVRYLNLFNSDASLPIGTKGEDVHFIGGRAFLDYSAKNWGAHFREANIMSGDAIIPFALRICNPSSRSYLVWFGIYWKAMGMGWETPGNFTNLMVASHYGHHAVVKLLLEKSADINAKDTGGRTPLWWAAESGHEAIVRLLLEKSANINAKGTGGQTPLWSAAESGHEAIVWLLLENGADINAKGTGGRTLLWWACENGHEAVVRLLLKKGADVNTEGIGGQTPLSWAAESGHEAIARLLLENGADIDPKGIGGRTPLWWAAVNGHEAVVRLLLKNGADINARDIGGQTPLWAAARNGHEAIVRLLLEKGDTDIDAKDHD